MEELVFKRPKNVSDSIKKNPSIKNLFILNSGVIKLNFAAQDFDFTFDDFKLNMRFILKVNRSLIYSEYHYCHVTYKRCNVIFYKDETTNKENYITTDCSNFNYRIFPTKILAGNKETMKITCPCKLTEIIYD